LAGLRCGLQGPQGFCRRRSLVRWAWFAHSQAADEFFISRTLPGLTCAGVIAVGPVTANALGGSPESTLLRAIVAVLKQRSHALRAEVERVQLGVGEGD